MGPAIRRGAHAGTCHTTRHGGRSAAHSGAGTKLPPRTVIGRPGANPLSARRTNGMHEWSCHEGPAGMAIRPLPSVLMLCAAWALTGCANRPATQLQRCPAALGAPMLVFELFFGRSIPGNGKVTDRQWNAFVDQVIVPNLPNGFTSFDADGAWMSPAGRTTIRQHSKVLLVALPTTGDRYRADPADSRRIPSPVPPGAGRHDGARGLRRVLTGASPRGPHRIFSGSTSPAQFSSPGKVRPEGG